MRFLPVFLDLTSGTVALVGSGRAAVSQAAAVARGRRQRPLVSRQRRRRRGGCCSPARRPVALELSFADPLQPTIRNSSQWSPRQAAARSARSPRARAPATSRSMSSIAPSSRASSFPAIVDRGDVVVAIGTGGASPVLARRLRERIEAALPARIGDLAALMGRYRGRFAKARHASAVAAPVLGARHRRADRRRCAGRTMARSRSGAGASDREHAPCAARCRASCYLVGAGPGDPDLLTLRALAGTAGRRRDLLRRAGQPRTFSIARVATPSGFSSASGAASRASARTRSTAVWSKPRARAATSCGSRAAIRSSSAAAARSSSTCAPPASRCVSFRA